MKKETLKSLGIGILGSIIGMFAVRKIDDIIDDFGEYIDEQKAMGGPKWSEEDKKKYDEILKKSVENIRRDMYGDPEEEIDSDDESDELLHEMFGQPMEDDGTPQGPMSFDDIRKEINSHKNVSHVLPFGSAVSSEEFNSVFKECQAMVAQQHEFLQGMRDDLKGISEGIEFLKDRAKKKDVKKETKKKNKAQMQKTIASGIMKDAGVDHPPKEKKETEKPGEESN